MKKIYKKLNHFSVHLKHCIDYTAIFFLKRSASCMNHGGFIGYNTAAKMSGPEFLITAQMNCLRNV